MRTLRRAGLVLLCASALASAQDVVQMSVTGEQAAPVTKVALTSSLILAGASGAQWIKTPKAWERTWAGFGARVADQTGFYLVQTSTFRSLKGALDYRPDAVLCPRDALLRCAVTATFTAFDRRGARRVNTPLIASIVVGTGASLAWRPERQDNADAWTFVGTRLGIAFGGYVVERVVLDWWAQRAR